MEEKVLIKAEFDELKPMFAVLWLLSVLTWFAGLVFLLYWEEIALFYVCFLAAVVILVVTLLLNSALKKRRLIVTNTRIIACAAFGYRRDITFEHISSIGRYFWWGIGVGSSSCKVRFNFVKNRDEIYDVLVKQLINSTESQKRAAE